MKIKINLMRDDLRRPERGHYNDVGLDVFSPTQVVVPAGGTAKIPLGFGVEIPDGFMGNIFTRSSMAAKGLSCEMPPIDPGYRGEIHCIITNHKDHAYMINPEDKIGQLVIMPIVYAELDIELGEERGTGAFGSTGK